MRKLIAIAAMLILIAVWIFVAATIGSQITDAPRWLQLVFYVVAGVAWILPMRPIFAWVNRPRDTDAGRDQSLRS